MEDTKNFDLVVIGTGAAASTVAYKCNAAGWKVAVIDSRPFGGTCALRGCDPKKVLVGAAEVIDWNQRMQNNGLDIATTKDTRTNWQELMQFKRTFTRPVPKNREEAFSRSGTATFHGRAQFVDSTTLRLNNGSSNNVKDIQGKFILISTGAKPAKLNIPGEENLTT